MGPKEDVKAGLVVGKRKKMRLKYRRAIKTLRIEMALAVVGVVPELSQKNGERGGPEYLW